MYSNKPNWFLIWCSWFFSFFTLHKNKNLPIGYSFVILFLFDVKTLLPTSQSCFNRSKSRISCLRIRLDALSFSPRLTLTQTFTGNLTFCWIATKKLLACHLLTFGLVNAFYSFVTIVNQCFPTFFHLRPTFISIFTLGDQTNKTQIIVKKKNVFALHVLLLRYLSLNMEKPLRFVT